MRKCIPILDHGTTAVVRCHAAVDGAGAGWGGRTVGRDCVAVVAAVGVWGVRMTVRSAPVVSVAAVSPCALVANTGVARICAAASRGLASGVRVEPSGLGREPERSHSAPSRIGGQAATGD